MGVISPPVGKARRSMINSWQRLGEEVSPSRNAKGREDERHSFYAKIYKRGADPFQCGYYH